jgi:hypothetical protein
VNREARLLWNLNVPNQPGFNNNLRIQNFLENFLRNAGPMAGGADIFNQLNFGMQTAMNGRVAGLGRFQNAYAYYPGANRAMSNPQFMFHPYINNRVNQYNYRSYGRRYVPFASNQTQTQAQGRSIDGSRVIYGRDVPTVPPPPAPKPPMTQAEFRAKESQRRIDQMTYRADPEKNVLDQLLRKEIESENPLVKTVAKALKEKGVAARVFEEYRITIPGWGEVYIKPDTADNFYIKSWTGDRRVVKGVDAAADHILELKGDKQAPPEKAPSKQAEAVFNKLLKQGGYANAIGNRILLYINGKEHAFILNDPVDPTKPDAFTFEYDGKKYETANSEPALDILEVFYNAQIEKGPNEGTVPAVIGLATGTEIGGGLRLNPPTLQLPLKIQGPVVFTNFGKEKSMPGGRVKSINVPGATFVWIDGLNRFTLWGSKGFIDVSRRDPKESAMKMPKAEYEKMPAMWKQLYTLYDDLDPVLIEKLMNRSFVRPDDKNGMLSELGRMLQEAFPTEIEKRRQFGDITDADPTNRLLIELMNKMKTS